MHPRTFQRAVFATLLAAVGPLLCRPSPPSRRGAVPTPPPPAGRSSIPRACATWTCGRARGEEAQLGKIVEVHYVGWLDGGIRFDSSRDDDRPFTFRLGAGDAIKGLGRGARRHEGGGKAQADDPARSRVRQAGGRQRRTGERDPLLRVRIAGSAVSSPAWTGMAPVPGRTREEPMADQADQENTITTASGLKYTDLQTGRARRPRPARP